MTDEWNKKAVALAQDGRSGRIRQEEGGDRDATNRDLVRFAYWMMDARRTDCQAARESTYEAHMLNVFSTLIQQAREDERERISKPLAAGIESILGEEAFALLVSAVQWD